MTESTPLVSVVIPTYNQPGYLIEAIDSVLKQTFKDFEIVIINDGSTDDTLERLSPFGDQLRIITQPNGGIGAARNRGIDEARGKYVALLDHDDYWMPEKLAVQVEFFEKHPSCSAVTVPHATSNDPQRAIFDRGLVTGPDGLIRNPFYHMARGQQFIQTSALMIDRERTRGIEYGRKRNAIEDIQFNVRLFSRGDVGVAGDRVLAVWRVHPTNFSKKPEYTYEGIKLLRAMDARGDLGDFKGEQRRNLNDYLAHIGRVAAMHQLMFGQRRHGLELYTREFLNQIRAGRLRFLMAYPALVLVPQPIMWRRFGPGKDAP